MTLCCLQRLIIKIYNTFVSKEQVVSDCIVEILQPLSLKIIFRELASLELKFHPTIVLYVLWYHFKLYRGCRNGWAFAFER